MSQCQFGAQFYSSALGKVYIDPTRCYGCGVCRAACQNDQQCVYWARARYDQMIHQINRQLRQTWDKWQHQMQQVTSHYCDVEATDGIDHMIYTGHSIDPQFTQFHLRSLRYEQLRAMCDCGRTAFEFNQTVTSNLQVTHLVLVQDATVDIFHDEHSEGLFDVRGTHDTRYEIVKKRIDKAIDTESRTRITQPGMLTIVYSTEEEWAEYQRYLRYLHREGWVDAAIDRGTVEPLQGVTGLKFARVQILPDPTASPTTSVSPDLLHTLQPELQLDQSLQPDH
jgi:ferredoxin